MNFDTFKQAETRKLRYLFTYLFVCLLLACLRCVPQYCKTCMTLKHRHEMCLDFYTFSRMYRFAAVSHVTFIVKMLILFGCASGGRRKDNKRSIAERQSPLIVNLQTPAKLALLMHSAPKHKDN